MPRSWRGICRATVVLAIAALTATATTEARPASPVLGPATGVRVDGTVGAPATYTPAQLEALPQTMVSTPPIVPGGRSHTYTGVSLEAVVKLAQPVLPKAKNGVLRVTVDVRDRSGRVLTFAVGELDPSFGNHPASLVLTEDGAPVGDAPELLVPGDDSATRSLRSVAEVTVSVQSPPTTTPPSPGAVTVHDGGRTVVVAARRLALLPSETLDVSFGGPGGIIQQHTESGPRLSLVLAVAGIPATSSTWVAAVGSDGYVATVTPAEATAGGRPLIVSLREDGVALAQPRLVADGDVKGGRYVSDMTDLYAGEAFPLG